jgi:hypothetical protein
MVIPTLIERETFQVFEQNLAHIVALICRWRTEVTIMTVDRDMLTRVWNDMDYRIDVCRINKGGHIEHICNM